MPFLLNDVSDSAFDLSKAPEGFSQQDCPSVTVPRIEDTRGDYATLEALKSLGSGILLVFFCYVVHNATIVHPGQNGRVLLCDLTSMALTAPVVVAAYRNRIAPRFAHPVAAGLILIVALNVAYSAFIRRGTLDISYIPFVFILAGAALLSTAWLLGALLVVTGITIPVAVYAVSPAERVDFILSCVVGAALMVSIFLSRKRAHRRMLRLRTTDRRLTSSLRKALERSEQRLREQQQVEQRRQELENQLRQSQKLEAVGVLAGGVAHDMNNVLGAITSIASLAGEHFGDGDSLRSDLADILSAARRGSALTRNLLGFARQGTRIKERFRLETTIESIAHLLRRTISKQVDLDVATSDNLDDIMGDPGQLSHVIMNLCINSVDAMQGHGTITIRAKNKELEREQASALDLPEGRYIELSVEDTGCGIAADVLPHVFEPFFSTKNSNERSGLGLSMVYGTVREHGGTVSISSAMGKGTEIRILMPSQPRKPASVVPPSVPASHIADPRRTILLVDDEPLLRSAGRRIIKSLGFEALVAANGAEAVAVFRRHRDEIGLVVLDVAMPVMGGKDCFWRLRELDSTIPVLVASGFAKHGGVDELLAAGATGYLAKPYDRDQMSSAIHRCLTLSATIQVAVSAESNVPVAHSRVVNK